MSVCVRVGPFLIIFFLVFCYKIDCIRSLFFLILNLKGHQNCIIGSQVFIIVFLKILFLPFTKVKSQINQLQKDSLGKSYEWTLVSECVIFVSDMVEKRRAKNSRFVGDWSRSRSPAAASCCAYWGS